MNKREQYIQPDNSYYKPSRDPNEGTLKLVVVMTALFVILTAVLAVVYFNRSNIEETLVTGDVTNESGFISVATPTPSPIPPITDYQNPILYPENASINTYTEDPVAAECDPAARGITEKQDAVAKHSLEYHICYAHGLHPHWEMHWVRIVVVLHVVDERLSITCYGGDIATVPFE